jgi:phosphopantothenoylcysteine decarboxylase / phosphopantothenate---cysteine ligase
MSITLSAEQQSRLRGSSVVVGLTGGIAVYKMCEVVSTLAQVGADVTVLMTQAATRFVTPLSFQALSGNPVYTSMWEHKESSEPQHIALARRADAMMIAPCTMDSISKIAHGGADSVVTLVSSALDRTRQPTLVAPSMNAVMWSQPATQRNVNLLREDGFIIVEPGEGWQACRAVGAGRMAEPHELLVALSEALSPRTGARIEP